MKKIHILFVALCALMLASCVNEEINNGDNGRELSNKELAFYFGDSQTRSAEAIESMEEPTGVSFSVGKDESGTEYFLSETVVNLNANNVATRGIPVYNENIVDLEEYKSFDAVTYLERGVAYPKGDATFKYMGAEYTATPDNDDDTGPGKVYINYYDTGIPWPDDEEQNLYFFVKMPTDYLDSQADGFEYNSTDGTIEFDYSSPKTAAAQKDILFSSRTLNKKEYKQYYTKTGAPMTMHHALTAVKFRTGHENANATKTIITKVEFVGLKGTGHCKVDPSTGEVTWDQLGNSPYNFSQTFSNPAYDPEIGKDNLDGTVDFASGTEGQTEFGESFYKAAADKNLNNPDGSLTFWLVPQEIPDDVTLNITFLIKTPDTKDGREIPHTIENFGEKLKKAGATEQVTWGAGELRTYTLMPEDVDVKIVDEMEDYKKSDLHVTNTGNVDEYVRIMVIGNWYDKDGNILVGYKYSLQEEGLTEEQKQEMILPWYREGYEGLDPDDPNKKVDPYGEFDGTFPLGRPAAGRTDWVRGTGSYFYYTEVIGAGEVIDPRTNPLFKYYELDPEKIPTIYIPSSEHDYRVPAEGVHLVMEVVIQAIGTTKPDGTTYNTCWEAWSAATGKEIKAK